MSGTYKGHTEAQIRLRIKKGRGQGQGSSYEPWIYTWEVSSRGRSHRPLGNTANRIHHLLSDLELAVFLSFDWSPDVIDLREQFPLSVDDTVRIAEELGVPHPKYRGVNQVLSSDFLVDFSSDASPRVALQAKYASDLQDPKVIERLMIEKRYWEEKQVPWYIVTEKEVSRVALNNIAWLHPEQSDEIDSEELDHYHQLFFREFEANPDKKLSVIAQKVDVAYDLETGESLRWIRRLLAKRYWCFEINTPYRKLVPSMLIATEPNSGLKEVPSVSG